MEFSTGLKYGRLEWNLNGYYKDTRVLCYNPITVY